MKTPTSLPPASVSSEITQSLPAYEVPGVPTTAGNPSCLVIIGGEMIGRQFQLREPQLFIGRSGNNHITLEHQDVSRRHAVLTAAHGSYVLKDIGSTNGTWLDGDRVSSRLLQDGDIFRVGSTVFKYLDGGNIESAYYDELYQLTITDGLTRAHNKRYLLEHLANAMAQSLRYGSFLSVVMFDIDHFKKLNDTYGHLAGDAVLRDLAQRVRTSIRRADTFARYGGEEFVVVCAETSLEGAAVVAEKIRQLVESSPFQYRDATIDVTISVGAASMQEYLTDAGEDEQQVRRSEPLPARFLELADKKLYEAKQNGRNRVVA